MIVGAVMPSMATGAVRFTFVPSPSSPVWLFPQPMTPGGRLAPDAGETDTRNAAAAVIATLTASGRRTAARHQRIRRLELSTPVPPEISSPEERLGIGANQQAH